MTLTCQMLAYEERAGLFANIGDCSGLFITFEFSDWVVLVLRLRLGTQFGTHLMNTKL